MIDKLNAGAFIFQFFHRLEEGVSCIDLSAEACFHLIVANYMYKQVSNKILHDTDIIIIIKMFYLKPVLGVDSSHTTIFAY